MTLAPPQPAEPTLIDGKTPWEFACDWAITAEQRENTARDERDAARVLLTKALVEKEAAEQRLAEATAALGIDDPSQLVAACEQAYRQVVELQKRLAEVVGALEPFAKDAETIHPQWDDARNRSTLTGIKFTVGDMRRARAALAAGGGDGK